MSSPSLTIERYGLTEVYTSENPAADVIFVHGLNGDPERTWTSQKTHAFWPRDLLPKELDGRARILVYGYDADVVAWGGSGGVGKDMIHNHAERLVATLVANRRRQHAEERPIVFVAHSLGGLVVKRALIYSSAVRAGTRTERLRSIFLSTYGILFLGTPHHGSNVAFWGSYLEKIAGVVLPKRFVDSAPQLVEALKSNSETLVNIDRGFSSIMTEFHLYFFHEAKKTDMKGTLQFIVEEDSAAPTLPDVERASIDADHSHICKFDNERSPGYDLVTDAISYYVEEAETTHLVASRWQREKQHRRLDQGNLLSEMYRIPQPEISEPSSRDSSPAPGKSTGPRLLSHAPHRVDYEVEEVEDVAHIPVPK